MTAAHHGIWGGYTFGVLGLKTSMVPPLESEVLEMIKKNHYSQVSIKRASSLKSIQYSNAIELFFLFKFYG